MLEANPHILYRKIDAAAVKRLLAVEPNAVLLDVRTEAEYTEAHAKNAVLLPLEELCPETAARAIPSKTTPVLLYCSHGVRSAAAVGRLLRMGYRRVFDVGAI